MSATTGACVCMYLCTFNTMYEKEYVGPASRTARVRVQNQYQNCIALRTLYIMLTMEKANITEGNSDA